MYGALRDFEPLRQLPLRHPALGLEKQQHRKQPVRFHSLHRLAARQYRSAPFRHKSNHARSIMTYFVIYGAREWRWLEGGRGPNMNSRIKRNVHLFVFDTMADWEAAYAVAAINSPQFQSGSSRYRVVTVAATLAPVTTMGGVRIEPDVMIDAVLPEESAMLILPGGYAWENGGNGEALELAAQ